MNADHRPKTDVLAELAWEPSVNADLIGVTADNGVVTLTGHVATYWQKHAAKNAAGRAGSQALAEEINVRLPIHFERSDDELAAAALTRLAGDSEIPEGAVKVKVDQASSR